MTFEKISPDQWSGNPFTAIGMKKCRPGTMLSCLCRREQRDDILRCIFKNTTTLGVREHVCARHVLSRAAAQQDSPRTERKIRMENEAPAGASFRNNVISLHSAGSGPLRP